MNRNSWLGIEGVSSYVLIFVVGGISLVVGSLVPIFAYAGDWNFVLFLVLGFLGIGIFALTRLRPFAILCLLTFLLPFQIYINLGSVPLASGYVLVALFDLVVLVNVTLGHKRLRLSNLALPASTFLLAILLSYLSVVDILNFVFSAVQILYYVIFALLLANVVTTVERGQTLLNILIVGGVISALLGIGQFMAARFISGELVTDLFFNRLGKLIFGVRGIHRIGSVDNLGFFYRSALPGIGSSFRAFGLFGGGNSFGFYHALIYALALGPVTKRTGWWCRPTLLTLVILALAVFLSWSRMAWLMCFVATIYRFVSGRSGKPLPVLNPIVLLIFLLILSLALVGIVLILTLFPNFGLSSAVISTVTLSDASTLSRLQSMRNALDIFTEHPVFGVGLANLSVIKGAVAGQATNITAENLYLELLAEVGSIGFIAFIVLLRKLWKNSYSLAGNKHPKLRVLGQSACCVWIAAVVGFMFNAVLTEPRTMLMWWLLAGIVASLNKVYPTECHNDQ